MVNPLESMLGLAALLQEDTVPQPPPAGPRGAHHQGRRTADDRAGGPRATASSSCTAARRASSSRPARPRRAGRGPARCATRDVPPSTTSSCGRSGSRSTRGRALVQGDVSQLERLVDTLLDNAVAVTPASGVITVRVKRAEDRRHHRGRRRGSWHPAREPGGGLRRRPHDRPRGASDMGPWRSLPVCRRIAEQHGGTVTATSDHRGAVFTLRLPLSSRMLEHEPAGTSRR